MMNQSATLPTGGVCLPETWRRFYNGPNAGLIDVEVASREMPWLVGVSPSGITLNTQQPAAWNSLDVSH
jgi:hypothetical protein